MGNFLKRKKIEMALSLIISALRGKSLRSMQQCQTTLRFWEQLQQRYAGRSVITK